MHLYELFDKADTKFEVTDNSETRWKAITGKGKDKLSVEAFRRDPNTGIWSISFDVDGSHELTGNGTEFKVFQQVTNIMAQFFKDVNPDQIYMVADSANRASLYKRMLGRLLKGWKVIQYRDTSGGNFALVAYNGSEFPVKTTKDNMGNTIIGVHVLTGMVIGYRVDTDGVGPTRYSKEISGADDQLKPEMEKAKLLADEVHAKL